MELRAHELAELLEPLHELLIPSVFRQCLLGVGLELPDSLHVLWIAEQFLDLLVFQGFPDLLIEIQHRLKWSFDYEILESTR